MSRPCLASLRHRDWWPKLEAEMHRHGIEDFEIVGGGKHPKMRFEHRGKVVDFPISTGRANVGKNLPAALLRQRLRSIEGGRA